MPITPDRPAPSAGRPADPADGLAPAGPGAIGLRYARTGTGAGVVVPGHVVALGFPIEALLTPDDRAAVVAGALSALGE